MDSYYAVVIVAALIAIVGLVAWWKLERRERVNVPDRDETDEAGA